MLDKEKLPCQLVSIRNPSPSDRLLHALGTTGPHPTESAQIHAGPKTGDALCRPLSWDEGGLTYRHHRSTLTTAFGLPGCAEQSVLADTLNAATEADVAAVQETVADIFGRYGQAWHHDLTQDLLVLDVDLSPLPASKQAEGSERGYMGRSRSKTGRKLVCVRVANTQEIIWETVISGRVVESLPLLQEAMQAAEHRLKLAGDNATARAKRARIELREDS